LDQARDEIRAAGGDVVCVFHYRAQPTRNFCRQREVELECLGDPEREGYDAVGLERGGLRELASPKVAIRAIGAARKGALAGVPEGDIRQMPGTFVVGADGRVLFAHYNRDQSDNPPMEPVLEAVRQGAEAVQT
jgi:peroxiredoxin